MSVRFPEAWPAGVRLGVGMDLPWDAAQGFVRDPNGRDHLAEPVHEFLRESGAWSHVFFSIQPKDRGVPSLARYADAWADAVRAIPEEAVRALHTTALDLGCARPKRRAPLFDLVNGLAERHEFRWVNEDVGLWTLGGKPLPYPAPPYLTNEGLAASVDNVRECTRALTIPLLIEFPGFSEGVSLRIGPWDAYDYFRVLAEEAECAVTLDVGHLLSWRWLIGHRGEALFDDLDRLPLEHCFEIHLSGAAIRDDVFFDTHRGVLLDEQLTLLDRLLELCPNVRAVTYEDPVVAADGSLTPECRPSLARLRERVASHRDQDTEESTNPASRWQVRSEVRFGPQVGTALVEQGRQQLRDLDEAFATLVYDESSRASLTNEASSALRSLDVDELRSFGDLCATALVERKHTGTGTLTDVFPQAFSRWKERGQSERELARSFTANHARAAVEGMTEFPGPSLEQAFARFAIDERLLSPVEADLALARSLARTIAITEEPAFRLPAMFEPCPGGVRAVIGTSPPTLIAVVDGKVIEGPLTDLLADLLIGSPVEHVALTHRVPAAIVTRARSELVRRLLLAA